MTKRIAFYAKLDFQVLFCGVPQHNLPADRQQNRTMKNDQHGRDQSEADQHTMPNPPVAPHLFLIVFGHQSDCIAALSESKYDIWRQPLKSSLRAETCGVTLSKFLSNESRQAL